MKAFDESIKKLKEYLEEKRKIQSTNFWNSDNLSNFLEGEKSEIVLKEDTWVELGNPKTFSLAPILLTDDLHLINDGIITLLGPDIQEAQGSIPFAQILLIGSTELKDEDYRKLNLVPFELNLKGYMIKSFPSDMRIWSRVSKEAVERGFSFGTLGKALIKSVKSKFDVESAEVNFITSREKDVKELKNIATRARKIANAMDKMVDELSFDCATCEYSDVCSTVNELKKIRKKLIQEGKIT